MIKEGLHDIPEGHIPAVVTRLEMTVPTLPANMPFPDGFIAERERPENDVYRAIFSAVGGPWLWNSRMVMDDAALTDTLDRATTEVWILRQNEQPLAFFELDFSKDRACELLVFGMIPSATGQGLGRPLMATAQRQAFARDIDVFVVKTCNWDSPHALGFYQKAGFLPTRFHVDVFPDPRLNGIYPKSTAPHVPCLS